MVIDIVIHMLFLTVALKEAHSWSPNNDQTYPKVTQWLFDHNQTPCHTYKSGMVNKLQLRFIVHGFYNSIFNLYALQYTGPEVSV